MDDDITRYRTLILFDGSTFFLSDPNGDVAAGQTQGFFHDDVRHLSLWRLLVDGRPLEAYTRTSSSRTTRRASYRSGSSSASKPTSRTFSRRSSNRSDRNQTRRRLSAPSEPSRFGTTATAFVAARSSRSARRGRAAKGQRASKWQGPPLGR